MSLYRIKEAVCDWGIFDGDELLLVINYRKNAEKILEILEQDIKELHGEVENKRGDKIDCKLTNFERIKAMGVKELAKFLKDIPNYCHFHFDDGDCSGCPLEGVGDCTKDNIEKWLESEVSK